MPTKKSIVQYINQMYHEHLDEENFSARLARLKQMGGMVSSVVFDLIKTADPEKKHFLFTILSELGDHRILDQLRDMISNPHEDDETKLMAAVAVSQLEGSFDVSFLEKNLNDAQSLGKKIVENMLKKSDDPNFIQMFLENFPNIVREGQFAALEDLLVIKKDKRLVNIVGPLSAIVDDELKQFIIPILVNSYDRRAFYYLQEIIKKTNSSEIQIMARQAIFKLGTYIKNEASSQEPQYKFYQAYATTCDGSGSSIYIFSVIDKNKKIKLIDFVNNDLLGIKDAFGGIFTKEDYNQFIRRIKAEGAFLTVEVPATFILQKVKIAEDLTDRAHRTLPVEYLALRDIFNDLVCEDLEFEKIQKTFAKYKSQVLRQINQLIPQTKNLYNFDEVRRSWFIDYELMANAIEEFIAIELKANDDLSLKTIKEIEKLYLQTAKKLYKSDFLELMVDRLKEYSWLCFIGNKKERSQLAIVVGETLLSSPPENHPFLKRMLEHSFEVHLYESDEDLAFDEDAFDDDYPDAAEDEYEGQTEYADENKLMNELSKMKIQATESSTPIFPEASELSEFDKLKFLAEKMSTSPFGKDFDPQFMNADLKTKIRQVNYLESVYDVFTEYYVGKFDWNLLRTSLHISVPAAFSQKVFVEIQDFFLTNMVNHGFDNNSIDVAKRLWSEAIYLSNGDLKPISKPISWSAGIESLVGSLLFKPTPMEILENDYQTSSTTIRKRMEQLSMILNIRVFPSPKYKYILLNKSMSF